MTPITLDNGSINDLDTSADGRPRSPAPATRCSSSTRSAVWWRVRISVVPEAFAVRFVLGGSRLAVWQSTANERSARGPRDPPVRCPLPRGGRSDDRHAVHRGRARCAARGRPRPRRPRRPRSRAVGRRWQQLGRWRWLPACGRAGPAATERHRVHRRWLRRHQHRAARPSWRERSTADRSCGGMTSSATVSCVCRRR